MTVSSLKLNRSRCVLMAALLLLAPSLGAQQTGTMTGQITDSRTGRPISAVQVYISALDLGTLTQLNGRYLLLGVSPGTYTLTAERIGYERVEQEVTIGTGGASAAVQDFMLNEDALQLDEIIVTGTPGGTLRRALGNSVARVDVSGIAQTLQAPNLDQLLASATPGLNAVLGMSGDVAGGARIRVRGASSMQLGSTPLLYVDGVRVNNAFTGRTRSFATPLQSRLNDFNPEDIESIEIVKGPSAATLYGTEASAGVIQIITKRGRTGAPQFDISVEGGTNFLLDPQGKIANTYWMFEDGTVETWNFMEQREKDRVAGLDNDWLRRGVGLDVTGSVRGGTDQVRYYVSGSSNNQEGFVDWNFNDMLQGRANIDVILSDNFDLAVSSMTMRSKHRAAQNPRPFSISNHVTYAHAGRTSSRGYYIAPPETERLVENGGEMNRFTSSLQLNHTAGPFRSRVIAGYDRTDQILNEFFPPVVEGADHPDLGSFGLGQLTRTDLGVDALALEFGSSARFDLSPAWVSETAVGVQYNSERTTTGGVLASDFAAVGLTAVGAAAVRNASGTFIEDKSLGVYVQQQFEWENRRFFTVAVRGDDHSAFGANFDAAIYPKVSGAWVLSEESFWNVPLVTNFRLRGAWGKAGRQPAAFAAVSLYSPETGPEGGSSIIPSALGNPDLGPEVSTEIEVGFDAGLLDDRVSLTFTAYNKTTRNAILSEPASSSTGFLTSRQVNAGEINNRGLEFTIDAALLERGSLRWDMGFNLAYNRNRLVSLGGLPETGGTRQLREGYPVRGYWAAEVVSATITGDPFLDPIIDPMCKQEDGSVEACDPSSDKDVWFKGNPDPAFIGALNSSIRLGDIRLFANVEFKTGFHISSTIVGSGHSSFRNQLSDTGFPQEGIAPDTRVLYLLNEQRSWSFEHMGVFPGGFARLRELSLQYDLPNALADRMGASRASITLGGSNLWYLWIQAPEWYSVPTQDPEMGNNTSNQQYSTGGGNSVLFTSARATATVRMTF
jgi:TonB-linked SusC/RagA family outer membrane protein